MLQYLLKIVLGMITLSLFLPAFAADNLRMDGTLVTEPCSLDSATANLIVDFKNIVDKALYANLRTPGQKFEINLVDCDPGLAKSVNIIFKGDESTVLPGLLATTGTASGIAIGIEREDGSAIDINRTQITFPIEHDRLSLTFQGYIRGEPEAISKHAIIPGDFTSTATFELNYP